MYTQKLGPLRWIMGHCQAFASYKTDSILGNRFSWRGSIYNRDKGSEYRVPVILSRSKRIMVVRLLGKNQWLLTDKIMGPVCWQCLGEAESCFIPRLGWPVGIQCLHPLRLQTLSLLWAVPPLGMRSWDVYESRVSKPRRASQRALLL